MAQIDLILTPIKLKSLTKRSPRWRLSTTRWLQRKVPFLASERGDFILLCSVEARSVGCSVVSVNEMERREWKCRKVATEDNISVP